MACLARVYVALTSLHAMIWPFAFFTFLRRERKYLRSANKGRREREREEEKENEMGISE